VKLLDPLFLIVVQPSSKAAQDYPVRGFGLAVGLRVFDGREALFCIDRNEKLGEFPVRELCSVVGS
jgi:hypothetical protein